MRWRDFDLLPTLPSSFFDTARRVHFVGVGGIGMSALAFALCRAGHSVSGSDAHESAMLTRLRAAGVRIVVGHAPANLTAQPISPEALIYGSAITPDNPELQTAAEAGLPAWHRAQLLGHFVGKAKCSVAVSGTHGKSTTSAMIAHILCKLGRDPMAILGAEYTPFASNFRPGDPDLLVVEADESDGSFTLLQPSIAVVLNVEPEHLENYDHRESELWRAFGIFSDNARCQTIFNGADRGLHERWDTKAATTSYALGAVGGTQLSADDVSCLGGVTEFLLSSHGVGLGRFSLGVPGIHNVSNALAAICACTCLGIDAVAAAATLTDFHGVKRRFERIGEAGGVVVYNDYGHHPTEVACTLETAREFLQRPILAVFQPHRYSRTQQMGHDFGVAFEAADRVIVTELYSAFEEPIPGVSGRIVADAVTEASPQKEVVFAPTLAAAEKLALEMVQAGDAIFCLGAGDIDVLPGKLLDELKSRETPSPSAVHSAAHPNEKTAEPLARHCTLRVGGPAAHWVEPQDEAELMYWLDEVRRRGMPLQIFGAGSNLVPHDNGFDGIVLKLGAGFAWTNADADLFSAGGATLLPRLTHSALAHGLGNLEWACGVPGSLGGSIWGNAGARGYDGHEFVSRDCAADLHSLVAYDRSGTRHLLSGHEVIFGYRKSSLHDLIVTAATFKLRPLDDNAVQKHREAVKELLRLRRLSQPVSSASAGCIWKNTKAAGFAGTGQLIESLGLMGSSVGGAQISRLHANFIVNAGHASGDDVRQLAKQIEECVRTKTGIVLEREARFLDG